MYGRRRAPRRCAAAAMCGRDAASRAVPGTPRSAILVGVLTSTLLAAAGALAREKIDVITLVNGDRITGEIKQLDVGILTVSSDHVGTISVEWVAVVSVESTQLFEVILAGGDQLVGTFDPGPASGKLVVSGPEGGRRSCSAIASSRSASSDEPTGSAGGVTSTSVPASRRPTTSVI